MKPFYTAIALTLFLGSPAAANCSYLGGYYGVGSTICSAGGWLEQCTVAGYWSAIGQCNTPDTASSGTPDTVKSDVAPDTAEVALEGTDTPEVPVEKSGN